MKMEVVIRSNVVSLALSEVERLALVESLAVKPSRIEPEEVAGQPVETIDIL
jgi:hypothetical protein